VSASVAGVGKVAVAFSGGLDSSVLVCCAKRVTEVVTCTAAMDGSQDFERAKMAADLLGVDHVSTRITREEVLQEVEEMRVPFEPTVMDASLWSLYSIVARGARNAGAKIILLGQLADELFGGYAKYRTALVEGGEAGAQEMMERDVEEYAARGRIRDVAACSRWVQPSFPFEAAEVRRLGLALPVPFKISPTESKLVLRRAAGILGVPEEISGRPKKAAQYSSGIQKVVLGARLFNARPPKAEHDSIATT
jgi:asparagine synthase (glutamine-hydrolysing)